MDSGAPIPPGSRLVEVTVQVPSVTDEVLAEPTISSGGTLITSEIDGDSGRFVIAIPQSGLNVSLIFGVTCAKGESELNVQLSMNGTSTITVSSYEY
jgi:hypothetical protein